MGQYSSYYLYQKYEKRGDQPFVPVYPAVYSVDGDGTREPVVKNENDYQCGWTGETGTLYRWVDLPIDTDYICDECPEVQYRWVTVSGYVCSGTTKYNKEQEQVSYDSGETWFDMDEYRRGSTIIETESEDCGYVPPVEPVYRWIETGEYRCEYSADTPDAQYRWYRLQISDGYVCSGMSKYYKEVYQVSTDGGSTWNDVVPAQYRMGDLYEADSSDCESEPYSDQYFTIESLVDDNEVRFVPHNSRTISASTDGGNTWSSYAASSSNDRPAIATLNAGQKVLIKGLNSTYYDSDSTGYTSNFDTSGNYIAYGNIMSLVYGDSFATATTLTGDHNFMAFFNGKKLISAANLVLPATTLTSACYAAMFSGCGYLTAAPQLPATTLADRCYHGMFRGCGSLTTAPELPATTLADYCYGGMFYGCTSLTTAPELPATTLAQACYHSMFQGCTSLTTAPELPATTLAKDCYERMFEGCTSLVNAPELPATTLAESCYGFMFCDCTSLTTAPELPATTLVSECYANMFDGCKKLNYIKCLATNASELLCTNYWVDGVASSGTFVKNSAAIWDSGPDGIPKKWTVQNA